MLIPYDQLSPETLRALVEEFVTRDGTDLTEAQRSIDRVLKALKLGHVVIDFDEEEGTTDIRPVDSPGQRRGQSHGQSRDSRDDDSDPQ